MMTSEQRQPLIVDVKRHCLADGPGIRSVVFFKGCPLRCTFCHNPETQHREVEIAFRAHRCIACGCCAEACGHGAIDLSCRSRIHRSLCQRCGECTQACPSGALMHVGRRYEVEELAEILLRDQRFYFHSGGGVTFSGGECTMYPDYLSKLGAVLKANEVHIALETCGEFEFESFRDRVLPYIDLVYYDVKLADPERHREITGRTNDRILANLRRLLAMADGCVQPRVPLIPDVTDDPENLTAIVDTLLEAGAAEVTLLPYNPLGQDMAVNLGRPRPRCSQRFVNAEEENRLRVWFESMVQTRRRRRVS